MATDWVYKNIRPTTAAKVEAQYMELFPNEPPTTRGSVGIDISGMGAFDWNILTKQWQREVRVRTDDPPHKAFIVYGEMKWLSGKPLAIFRIPNKGTNWHKQILPGILKVVRDNGNPKFSIYKVQIDGDPDGHLWEKCADIQHYDWNGKTFVLKG